jgi:hypothetical protein
VFGAYPWSEQNFFYTWLSATGENIAPDWPHGAWLANACSPAAASSASTATSTP